MFLFLCPNLVTAVEFAVHFKDEFEKLRIEIDPDTKQPISAWIVQDNTEVYSSYKSRKSIKTLEFSKRYNIVNNNYKRYFDGRRWSLLAKKESDKIDLTVDDIIGWVDDERLITSRYPLINLKTNILEKVLIKEGDSVGRDGSSALRVYSDPYKKSSSEGIEIRTVFYIYDYYPHLSGRPSSKKTKRLLIGANPVLNPYKDKEPLLIGWVDRDKVTFWNSRIACEFKVGERAVIKSDNGELLYDSKKVIDKPLRYNSLRNPILQEDKAGYRIGFFSRLDIMQLQLQEHIKDLSSQVGLEVMFAIDGTRSMTKAFKDTLGAVEETVNILSGKFDNLKKIEQPMFGLLLYRDKKSRNPVRISENGKILDASNLAYCHQETTLVDLSYIDEFLHKIGNYVACDCDQTNRESLFLGLAEGVQNSKFLQGKDGGPRRLRIVIHIGDAGDNNQSKYNAKMISKLMERKHIFNYIAVDLTKKNRKSTFENSVKEIIDQLSNVKGIYIREPINLKDELVGSLKNLHDSAHDVSDQIEIISRGFAGTNEGRIGVVSPEILNYAKRIIESNNIDLKKLDVFQQYIEGSIPKSSKIEKYVLVQRENIEDLNYFLGKIILEVDNEYRTKAWNSVMKNLIGEESCIVNNKEITLEKCNRMRNGLPIKAGFLKYSKKKFLNLNDYEAKNVECEAKIILEQMRHMLEDKLVVEAFYEDPSECGGKLSVRITKDLNNDGKVVQDGNVYTPNMDFIRKADENDMKDLYLFAEGGGRVAWIPIKNFESLSEPSQ